MKNMILNEIKEFDNGKIKCVRYTNCEDCLFGNYEGICKSTIRDITVGMCDDMYRRDSVSVMFIKED